MSQPRSSRNPNPLYSFTRRGLLTSASLYEMARRGLEGTAVSGIHLDTLLPTSSPGRVSLRCNGSWEVVKFIADRLDRDRYVRITRRLFGPRGCAERVQPIDSVVEIPGTDISLHGYSRPYLNGVKLSDLPFHLMDDEDLDAIHRSFGALLYRLLRCDIAPVCAAFARVWDPEREDAARKCSFTRFLGNIVYESNTLEMTPFSAGGLFTLVDSKDRAEFLERIPSIEANFIRFSRLQRE